MSIYSTRSKRPVKPNVRRPVAAAMAPSAGGSAEGQTQGGIEPSATRRRAQPSDALLPLSLEWLASLPPDVRPLALATKYPRIANRIAVAWAEPSVARADFDDLVYDKRGDRQGFPPDVHRDLLALREYYYGYSPQQVLQA